MFCAFEKYYQRRGRRDIAVTKIFYFEQFDKTIETETLSILEIIKLVVRLGRGSCITESVYFG